MGIDCSDFLYRSRGYTLSSRSMRVRDGSLGKSFGTFLFTEKSTFIFLFTLRFFSKSGAIPFDRLCGWQRFGGGYKRRRPRSRGSRDPSIAAIFVNIMPEGAHTARALRLRARVPSRTEPPHGVALQCGSIA